MAALLTRRQKRDIGIFDPLHISSLIIERSLTDSVQACEALLTMVSPLHSNRTNVADALRVLLYIQTYTIYCGFCGYKIVLELLYKLLQL